MTDSGPSMPGPGRSGGRSSMYSSPSGDGSCSRAVVPAGMCTPVAMLTRTTAVNPATSIDSTRPTALWPSRTMPPTGRLDASSNSATIG